MGAMAQGTPWQAAVWSSLRRFFKWEEGSASAAAMSDFLRVFLLERLGGVYVDADVIFLTSWRLLFCGFHADFAYEWGPDRYMNTAVLALAKSSNLGRCLLQATTSEPQASLDNPFHPGELSRLVHTTCLHGLAMLPCEMFDPYWIYQYGRDEANAPPWMAPPVESSRAFEEVCQ